MDTKGTKEKRKKTKEPDWKTVDKKVARFSFSNSTGVQHLSTVPDCKECKNSRLCKFKSSVDILEDCFSDLFGSDTPAKLELTCECFEVKKG